MVYPKATLAQAISLLLKSELVQLPSHCVPFLKLLHNGACRLGVD